MHTNVYNKKEEIALLIGHCEMYLYGAQGSAEFILNPVAKNFYSFALLHLISTMFIVRDNRKDVSGGVFHRTLDKLGLSGLMSDIDTILVSPVGKNSLAEYIQQKRNKLATHGSLLLESEKSEVSEVTTNQEYTSQYTDAMYKLDDAVGELLIKLEKIHDQGSGRSSPGSMNKNNSYDLGYC